jgi:hypothetical protein
LRQAFPPQGRCDKHPAMTARDLFASVLGSAIRQIIGPASA